MVFLFFFSKKTKLTEMENLSKIYFRVACFHHHHHRHRDRQPYYSDVFHAGCSWSDLTMHYTLVHLTTVPCHFLNHIVLRFDSITSSLIFLEHEYLSQHDTFSLVSLYSFVNGQNEKKEKEMKHAPYILYYPKNNNNKQNIVIKQK